MTLAPFIIRSLADLHRHYPQSAAGDRAPGPPGRKSRGRNNSVRFRGAGHGFLPAPPGPVAGPGQNRPGPGPRAFMPPGTFVAGGLPDLAAGLGDACFSGPVVTKRDRAHLGLGVGFWPTLEALYSWWSGHPPAVSPGGPALSGRRPGPQSGGGGRARRGLRAPQSPGLQEESLSGRHLSCRRHESRTAGFLLLGHGPGPFSLRRTGRAHQPRG